jgi:hypothetical protein
MENVFHSLDNEFNNTCIIVIFTCTIPHRSLLSSASTLGSYHVFFPFCSLFIYDSASHIVIFFSAKASSFQISQVEQMPIFDRSRNSLKIRIVTAQIAVPTYAYQRVRSTSASPNTLGFCISKPSVGASSDPSR